MSISEAPAPSPGRPVGEGSDPFDTALITRLAQEFFAEPRGPAALPMGAHPPPTAPTTLAGFPGSLPPAPSPTLPALSGGSPGGNDLAGGYPQASAPTHPPVHPVLEPSEPAVVPGSGQPTPTPSGGHDPSCSDSYAFGEPRCSNVAFAPPETEREAGGPGSRSAAGAPASLAPDAPANPAPEAASAPEFYFLRGADAPHRSPLPGRPASITPGLSVFDVEAIRRDFPALHQRVNGRPLVWLDNAATTHKPQAVIDATAQFYGRDNSNIHRAAHTLAARSTELFESGREKVRQFLGAADAKEIVFVRGTTEAVNLVAQSYGRKNIGAGDEILLTRLEHHANIVPWQLLAQQTGAVIRVAPINDRGELILEEFARLLGPRTKIVAVTHVSNALGTVNPIEQIIPLAHARGVPVLVDGAQSTPHIPINVQALDADFFVFSGHKVFGPTGIGALYGKAALLDAMPPWQGGGHMIRDVTFEKTVYQNAPEKFEAGTPDIAGVVGLGAAIDYLFKIGIPALAAYEHSLLEYATHALAGVPGLRPIGTAANKASVLSFVIPGVANESIARHLDQHGIAVRAGHHCAQPAQRHFGLESTVRPSLAFYNSHADVDALVAALHRLPRR
jgi:cysteine desulfurase/selenocysteine lyase